MPTHHLGTLALTTLTGRKSIYHLYWPLRSPMDFEPRQCNWETPTMLSTIIQIRFQRRLPTWSEITSSWHSVATKDQLTHSQTSWQRHFCPGSRVKHPCLTLRERGQQFRQWHVWWRGPYLPSNPDRLSQKNKRQRKRSTVSKTFRWQKVDKPLLWNGCRFCSHAILAL